MHKEITIAIWNENTVQAGKIVAPDREGKYSDDVSLYTGTREELIADSKDDLKVFTKPNSYHAFRRDSARTILEFLD